MKIAAYLLLPLAFALTGCGARSNPSMPQRDGGIRADRYVPPPPRDFGVPYDYGVWDSFPNDLYQPPRDSWWIVDSVYWPDAGGCSAQINTPCQIDSDCCGGLQCVGLTSGLKVCSRRCTPDDPETPLVDEDNCPNNWELSCADILGPNGGVSNYCLRRCQPRLYDNACPDGIACHPKDNQLDYDLQTSSCVRPMCTRDEDCPIFGDKTCFSDQDCPQGAFCAEANYSGGLGNRCAVPGLCERGSGLCRPPNLDYKADARIGDTCARDLDCARGMRCQFEAVDASGYAYARNGYCILEGCIFGDDITHLACPAGSTCQRIYPGGSCFRSCKASNAADCRNVADDRYGDYECYNWTGLYLDASMKPIADTPTCEPAVYTCDFFYPFLDCSYIGEQGNPDNMRCRDPFTGQALPEGSANGVCLDDTASGTTTP